MTPVPDYPVSGHSAPDHLGGEATAGLLAVLGRAQRLGFIGKGADLGFEIAHSVRFGKVAFGRFGDPEAAGIAKGKVAGIGDAGAAGIAEGEVSCFDLGSGGGLPALAVALGWEETRWTLCEISAKRCDFLEWATRRLELDARVSVVEGSVDELVGDGKGAGAHAEKYGLVTARAFAPISRVLEVSVGLLAEGGLLLVSDPPDRQHTAAAQQSEAVAQAGEATTQEGDVTPRLVACGSHDGISVFRKQHRDG